MLQQLLKKLHFQSVHLARELSHDIPPLGGTTLPKRPRNAYQRSQAIVAKPLCSNDFGKAQGLRLCFSDPFLPPPFGLGMTLKDRRQASI